MGVGGGGVAKDKNIYNARESYEKKSYTANTEKYPCKGNVNEKKLCSSKILYPHLTFLSYGTSLLVSSIYV